MRSGLLAMVVCLLAAAVARGERIVLVAGGGEGDEGTSAVRCEAEQPLRCRFRLRG